MRCCLLTECTLSLYPMPCLLPFSLPTVKGPVSPSLGTERCVTSQTARLALTSCPRAADNPLSLTCVLPTPPVRLTLRKVVCVTCTVSALKIAILRKEYLHPNFILVHWSEELPGQKTLAATSHSICRHLIIIYNLNHQGPERKAICIAELDCPSWSH